MQNYKKLQDLNLREVSNKTQIELEFLQALQDKNFKTLNRFNVKGFLKILEREYGLDFSDFNEEYENYLNENRLHSQEGKPTTPPLISYTHKGSALPLILGVVMVCVLGFGAYYFESIKAFFLNDLEDNANIVSINVLKEAEQNLQDLEKSSVILVDNDEKNASAPESALNHQEENNASAQGSNSIDQEDASDDEISAAPEQDTKASEAIFRVKNKVWVGVIELKNLRKTTWVKEADFNISLSEDKLILAGAAAFSVVDEEGRERSYPAGASKRFLIKEGRITSIDTGEFRRLNGGKDW
ncbi:hypothetical protein [Campylobacter sp.]|uniref:hypothetical protein n=1 Tax=Campylobacter sp. TaxID=205 RepID=UPI0026DD0071|nr:hypothetical protein [Campylobacter sp.]MDO4673603.1 hypothetical protein [Campylobacter sp.]